MIGLEASLVALEYHNINNIAKSNEGPKCQVYKSAQALCMIKTQIITFECIENKIYKYNFSGEARVRIRGTKN